MYRRLIRMTLSLLILCGSVRSLLHAGQAFPDVLEARGDISQQSDPKKKEVTASVVRSIENETVTVNAFFPDDANPVKVSLYNILGKLIEVHPTTSVRQGDYPFRFLTKGLPSGPYIVVLEVNGQRLVNKVMVSR
jgi:hypothetical protein